MKRFLLVCVLVLSLSAPAVARADDGNGLWVLDPFKAQETVVWDEAEDGGVPKGVVGNDGVRCRGESSSGDLTHITFFYIGADGDEMASNPSRERAWQKEHCQNHSELMHGFFWDKRDSPHRPVKTSIERV